MAWGSALSRSHGEFVLGSRIQRPQASLVPQADSGQCRLVTWTHQVQVLAEVSGVSILSFDILCCPCGVSRLPRSPAPRDVWSPRHLILPQCEPVLCRGVSGLGQGRCFPGGKGNPPGLQTTWLGAACSRAGGSGDFFTCSLTHYLMSILINKPLLKSFPFNNALT